MNNVTYDRFPARFVALCAGVTVAIYAIGAYLIAPSGIVFVGLYLLFCLYMELRVVTKSCRDCYYYGKLCAFGRGKLCALVLPKGSPGRFLEKKITWMSLVPDLLVSLIPLVVGIVYLVRGFSWPRLVLLVVLVVLAFPVTGFVRGSISCKFCKQRLIGCPAMRLFERKDQPA